MNKLKPLVQSVFGSDGSRKYVSPASGLSLSREEEFVIVRGDDNRRLFRSGEILAAGILGTGRRSRPFSEYWRR
jgi:hypothetical protein